MAISANDQVGIPIQGALMNKALPSTKVTSPGFPELIGVDGRFAGCLRKFYGMRQVVNLATATTLTTIGDANGPSWFRPVAFRKKGTSTTYTGFVVRCFLN